MLLRIARFDWQKEAVLIFFYLILQHVTLSSISYNHFGKKLTCYLISYKPNINSNKQPYSTLSCWTKRIEATKDDMLSWFYIRNTNDSEQGVARWCPWWQARHCGLGWPPSSYTLENRRSSAVGPAEGWGELTCWRDRILLFSILVIKIRIQTCAYALSGELMVTTVHSSGSRMTTYVGYNGWRATVCLCIWIDAKNWFLRTILYFVVW